MKLLEEWVHHELEQTIGSLPTYETFSSKCGCFPKTVGVRVCVLSAAIPPPCRHLHYKFGRELLHIPSLPCLIDIHSFSSGLNVAVCTGEKIKITRQGNNRRRR